MHNFFTIEVEAERLQQERELAAASDARAAQAQSPRRNRGVLPRALRSLASFRAPVSPNTPVTALLELTHVPRPVAY